MNDLNIQASDFRRTQWKMLFAVMFCYLFFYTGRQNFGWAIQGIEGEFGVTKQYIGWAGAAMLWAYGIGQFINGNLADKYGARRMMVIGGVLSVIMNWATSFATAYWMIVLFWALNGFSQSLGWAPGSRLVSNWWGGRERGKAFGFYLFAAGSSSILIYLLSIIMLDIYDFNWRWLFRLPVLLLLLGCAVFYYVVRNKPEDLGFEPLEDETQVTVKDKRKDETSLQRYGKVLKNKKFMLACISIGFQNTARYGLLVWVPLYYLGTEIEESSNLWIALALPIGMALGTIFFGQLSDRVFKSNRSKPIALSLGLAGLVILMIYFVPRDHLLGGLLLMFLAGFLVYGPQSCYWPLSPDLLGVNRSGTGVGVMNTFAYAFAGAGEPFIGFMADITGQENIVFAVTSTMCFMGAFIILFVRR
ncbi:MFS transporter, OPA family, glycerol-3-phosphate transporter [Zhouia amylolytica]|uniref:MFS transporter, OPA family, glycerol-3-phosphate transporter n=1 Tax=Zhouia amylolytica TaxID=376730 RepID=A0A1I6VBS4_9FLAO|nr:MFS transporter [Zhouia amylolytica]MCQ0110430.1 MFS transporter [Zhouia amylolytica]SFT11129.1 MFS transporter, OPA family, glycerol-3-phosphate transporter [Zhouia amylolytica]